MIVLGAYLKSISGPVVVAIGVVIALTGQDKHVFLAMVLAVALGCAVGILVGWLVAGVGIPSFIVTLALFLAFQGILLFALKSQPIGVNNYKLWFGLAHSNMSVPLSWVFTIVVTVGYLLVTLTKAVRAQRAGLAADTVQLVLVRGGLIILVGLVITYFAVQNRNTNDFLKIQGIPWAASIPITLMIITTLALTKTTWGRHLFATGGNAEAARRAGIDVRHIKVTAFTINSGVRGPGRHLPVLQHRWRPARPRRRQHPAVRGRGCGHRRHLAVRRTRQAPRRHPRRAGHRHDPERDRAQAEPRRAAPGGHHRPRPADRRLGRRPVPPPVAVQPLTAHRVRPRGVPQMVSAQPRRARTPSAATTSRSCCARCTCTAR